MTSPRRCSSASATPTAATTGPAEPSRDGSIARNDCAIEVRECTGEATALMDAWTGFDDVVLVDACRGAGPPGSVHRIGPDEVDRVARLQHASTHSLGVAAAIGLARALGPLPSRLVIYAIEAAHSREGEGLSAEVDRAVRRGRGTGHARHSRVSRQA